jgi:DNA-3-methyladenine glycosylase I
MTPGKASGRCPWPGTDPLYVAYHDEEWGVPERDDRALYEKLVLDGFQAGLSWITILRKRDAFRRAFDGFMPEKIARYSSKKVEALMQDEASCATAPRSRRRFCRPGRGLRSWSKVQDSPPICGTSSMANRSSTASRRSRKSPAQTELSRTVSKDLKALGFKFCGPTIVYAFMQASGMVNDHLVGCHRRAACVKLGKA